MLFRRIADLLVMPLGMTFLLGITSLLLVLICRKDSRRTGRRVGFLLGVAAVAVLYLSSIRPTSQLLMWSIERSYPVQSAEAVAPVDAVFVFGGGPAIVRRADGTLLLDPGPRFDAAMRLIEADRARVLVLSAAGSKIPGDVLNEAEHLRTEALRRGVAPDRIADIPSVLTTGDEVRALIELSAARGWKRVALCTESWHLWRAMHMAQAPGIQFVPYSSGPSPPPTAQPWLLDWLPSMDSLWRTTRAWHEILGRLVS